MSILEPIAKFISQLCWDANNPGAPVPQRVFDSVIKFLSDNFGKNCASFVKSAFDWDEEEKAWMPHMDPGEALLDWLANK